LRIGSFRVFRNRSQRGDSPVPIAPVA
jgi:hypothetical protein